MARELKVVRLPDGTCLVERFSLASRIDHLLAIVLVLALLVTGIPQKFSDSSWAPGFLRSFGGLDVARTIHRLSGFLLAVHLLTHLLIIAIRKALGRLDLTLLPNMQDVRDGIRTLKYFMGHEPQLPLYPKFHLRQKLEYWLIVLGITLMILSGMTLLFPSFTTSMFAGQIIPAARFVHSDGALLTLVLILGWHVYSAHLSPNVFPFDKTIFTGYMPADDLQKRHGLEYQKFLEGAKPSAPKAEP